MATDETIEALTALGFTGLEAEVYTALLREAPTTAYRVAHTLGKPAANVYKAVVSLEHKGAVIVDDGESRMCRAIAPDELLARLARSFADQRERAARALARVRDTSADDRVYQLRSREQVFERARQMLDRTTQVAVLDVFPEPLEALRADVERALARGVEVAIKLYAPAEVPGAEVVVTRRGEGVLARWPGQWVNLVVDGSEHMLAFLPPDGDRVHQAVWSGSAYLSWVYHGALTSELALAALENEIESGASAKSLRASLPEIERRLRLDAPGYRAVIERFGTGDTDTGNTTLDERDSK